MHKNIFLIVGAVVLAAIIIIAVWASHAAKKIIDERRNNLAGLAVDFDGYGIKWLRAGLTLKGIKIYPAGLKEDQYLLAKADELSINVSVVDLMRKQLHAKTVVLEGPLINYIITGKKEANWDALKLSNDKAKNDGASWPLFVDKVKISAAAVNYENRINGQHASLSDVDITISNIKAAKNPDDLPTDFEVEGKIGKSKSKFEVDGKGSFLGEKISFKLNAKLAQTPLLEFESFYRGSVPVSIESGTIEVGSNAEAKEDILSSTHRAKIVGLKVGGGMTAEFINKYLMSQSRPIDVTANVSGDLSKGNFSVSTELSKTIFEDLMKRAGNLAPKVIEKAKQLPGTVQNKLKGLFK